MKTKYYLGLAVAACTFALGGHARAQSYSVIDLGTLGGTTSTANGIDNLGRVVGFSTLEDGSGHAFLFSDSVMQDLGTLGGTASTGNGVAGAGVVGAADPQGTASHAFLYSNESLTDLGTLGGNKSGAQGVNGSGRVVGFSTVDDGSVHAFIFADGQMADLNSMADLSTTDFKVLVVAKAINNAGQIVGDGVVSTGDRHAFVLTPLKGPPPAPAAAAAAQPADAAPEAVSEEPIPMDGGNWTLVHNVWVWIEPGGWWYDGGVWHWHGKGHPHPHPPIPHKPIHWPKHRPFPGSNIPIEWPKHRPSPTPGATPIYEWPKHGPSPTPTPNPTPVMKIPKHRPFPTVGDASSTPAPEATVHPKATASGTPRTPRFPKKVGTTGDNPTPSPALKTSPRRFPKSVASPTPMLNSHKKLLVKPTPAPTPPIVR